MKMLNLVRIGILFTLLSWAGGSLHAKTIRFGGYDWVVKAGEGMGPGPNIWSEDNVWVDAAGLLHLRIDNADGIWTCAQLATTKRLGLGLYQFWIIGRIDQLDPNVVLGLYSYPTSDVGIDGTHEVDIEFAKWGRTDAKVGNYTAWPIWAGYPNVSHKFSIQLNGRYTTHRFMRDHVGIDFQSLYGHRNDDVNEFQSWRFEPGSGNSPVSTAAMPLQMNLWLFKGRKPTDKKPVEIVVRAFKFMPLELPASKDDNRQFQFLLDPKTH